MKWGAGLGDLTLKGRLQVEIRTDIALRCLTAALWGGGVEECGSGAMTALRLLNRSTNVSITVLPSEVSRQLTKALERCTHGQCETGRGWRRPSEA